MIIFLIILVLLAPFFTYMAAAAGQPGAMQILNQLAYGGVGQIKFQVGGKAVNLDDSNLETKYIGYECDMPETNVWFRTSDCSGNFSGVGNGSGLESQ